MTTNNINSHKGFNYGIIGCGLILIFVILFLYVILANVYDTHKLFSS